MNLKKMVYLLLGFFCLGLGCVGILLPILPTVPFFLVTAFCFARSSSRLHDWFVGTKLYEKHLASFVKKEGMTVRTKVSIMAGLTLIMSVGFLLMDGVLIGRTVLAVVWVCHVLYFTFFVKTIREVPPQQAGTARYETLLSGTEEPLQD